MSIENIPPGGDPAPGPFTCGLCYPGVDTPDTIHLCFQGIKKGALWAPGDPDPPNDVHSLDLTANCTWTATIGGIDYTYQVVAVATLFRAQIVAGGFIFNKVAAGPCQIWSANPIVVPAGNKYYGGWCTSVPELEGTPFAIPDLMDLMSADPFWAQWIMPRPMESDQVVYGIYDGLDATNVKILIDHS